MVRGIGKFARARQGRRRNRRRGRPDGRDAHARATPAQGRADDAARSTDRAGRSDGGARRRRRGRRLFDRRPARAASARARSIGPHAVLTGRTTIGARNRIFQFTSIGEIPQDRKYGGEPTTTDDRRRQRVPRVRDDPRRHRAGSRRHDDRQRQPVPRLHARRARLRRRQQHDILEQCAARGPRASSATGWCSAASPGVHQFVPHRRARDDRRRRPIVLQDVPPFVTVSGLSGDAARHQQRRAAPARILRRTTSLAVRRAYKTLYREGRSLEDAKAALAAAAATVAACSRRSSSSSPCPAAASSADASRHARRPRSLRGDDDRNRRRRSVRRRARGDADPTPCAPAAARALRRRRRSEDGGGRLRGLVSARDARRSRGMIEVLVAPAARSWRCAARSARRLRRRARAAVRRRRRAGFQSRSRAQAEARRRAHACIS